MVRTEMPSASTRPKNNGPNRCEQSASINPTCPLRWRKSTRSSPRSFNRNGLPPGSARCSTGTTGSQYWRNKFPVSVPGAIRLKASFSSRVNFPARLVHLHGLLPSFADVLCACITWVDAVKLGLGFALQSCRVKINWIASNAPHVK
jgi:hypothetical protein